MFHATLPVLLSCGKTLQSTYNQANSVLYDKNLHASKFADPICSMPCVQNQRESIVANMHNVPMYYVP